MAESSSSQQQQQPPPSSQLPPSGSQDQPPSSSIGSISTTSRDPPPSSSDATVVVPKLEPGTTTTTTTDGLALDASSSFDQDVELNGTKPVPMANNATESENIPLGNPVQGPVAADGSSPSKKETSLREFLGKMDDFAPIIPDAVTAHYLTLAGLPPPGNGPNQTPPHLARLLALATQKFIADVAADSYQYARIRASNSSSASNPMGSLNAASGLNMPGSSGAAAAAGGAPGASGGEASGKGKAGTHLGIQRPGFGGGGSGGSGQGRTVLTMEDLGMAVGEYGVSVKRGEFYR